MFVELMPETIEEFTISQSFTFLAYFEISKYINTIILGAL